MQKISRVWIFFLAPVQQRYGAAHFGTAGDLNVQSVLLIDEETLHLVKSGGSFQCAVQFPIRILWADNSVGGDAGDRYADGCHGTGEVRRDRKSVV